MLQKNSPLVACHQKQPIKRITTEHYRDLSQLTHQSIEFLQVVTRVLKLKYYNLI